MNHRYLFYTLLVLMMACKNESSNTDNIAKEDTTTSSLVINDSIRHLYQRYLKDLDDAIPLKCRIEEGKVNPGDEAPRDTLFFVLREEMKAIVAEKNIFKLLSHVAPNIKTGFGGEDGLQEFIRMWSLDSPDKIPHSDLWPTLRTALALGGQFSQQGNYFETPYLGACMPALDDPYKYGAVMGAGVRLRSGPGAKTQVLKTISYDLVEFVETTPIEESINGESFPWVKVKLLDGTEGFLFGKFYRSPLDWRVGFQRGDDQQWKMVMLLAGD